MAWYTVDNRETVWRWSIEHFIIAISLFFFEVVFKIATGTALFPAIIPIFLLSLAIGFALEFLISLLPDIVSSIVRRFTVLALGIIFAIEFFVFLEYKVFYDVKTVVGGAGGVVNQFMGDALAVILTPSGIICLILFLLPFVLSWRIPFIKGSHAYREKKWPPLAMAGGSLAVCLAALLALGPFGETFFTRYNFQTSVPNFGLATSLIKDIRNGSAGGAAEREFHIERERSTSTIALEAGRKLSPLLFHVVGEYIDTDRFGPVMMDIDFSSLSGDYEYTDAYVQSLTPTTRNSMTGIFQGYNLIFISAEAFSAEAIREDLTPTLYRLANNGIQFTEYYQFASAGTTGGECANIFGCLATEGGDSVKGKAYDNNYFTMGNVLNRLGYNGWAFHNNTYDYYDRDITHNNLGYNNGYMGYGNGMEQWVEWQWPQSDYEMIRGTFDNLYCGAEPFNVYYMSVSGHGGYSWDGNAMSGKYYDEYMAAGLDYNETVAAYLACNMDLDRALEYLVGQLEERGMADHTVIVISADHFPYGLDSDGSLSNLAELYGYPVENSIQRDHNRLIIWSGSLEGREPIVVDDPVSAVDVLPTLLNLFGAEWDSRLLPGRDVFSEAQPVVFNLSYDWVRDLGTYFADSNTFIPREGATIPDGYVEATTRYVENKVNFCAVLLEYDYYGHIFGYQGDVQEVHDAGRANYVPPSTAEADAEETDG